MNARFHHVIGMDPGAKGSLVHIGGTGINSVTLFKAVKMPLFDDRPHSFSTSDETVDVLAVREFVTGIQGSPVHVIIERAQSMPDQSAPAMFNYGVGFGRLCAAVEFSIHREIDDTLVTIRPYIWKRAFGLPKAKSASVKRAKEIFRSLPEGMRWNEGLAEAALIALWRLNRLVEIEGQLLDRRDTQADSSARNARAGVDAGSASVAREGGGAVP